jgi:MFS family permease
LLPLMVHAAGGATQVGLIVAAFNLGGLSAPVWGEPAERYRLYRWIAIGGGLLTAMGLALFPVTTSPGAWAGLALLQGIGAVGASTVANLFIVESYPQDQREERIGWLQTFYGTGQICGLLLAGGLTQIPLHLGILVAAGVTALAALTAWWTTQGAAAPVTDKPFLPQAARHGEWPVGSPHYLFHQLTIEGLRREWRQFGSPFALFMLCWFLTFSGSWGFFSLYPVIMHRVYGIDPWLSSCALAVAHGLGILLYLPAGVWSERRRAEHVFKSALSLSWMAFLGLLGLTFVALPALSWIALLCVGFIILSWSLLSVSGTLMTAYLSQRNEGEGMGLFNATTALAGISGALLGGWVAEYWEYRASLAFPLMTIALALALSLAVSWRQAKRADRDRSHNQRKGRTKP